MRYYRLGAHTRVDLKVHLIWIPKYRKHVLTKEISIRLRDIIRQIAVEHEMSIISGKIAIDHVHVFISYRSCYDVAKIAQWLKGISSRVLFQEFPQLKRMYWGQHLWARGYLAVSSGNITDEMIQEYIKQQEGEKVEEDQGQFQIDTN